MAGDGRAEMLLPIEEQAEAEAFLGILKECTYGQQIVMLNYLNVVRSDIEKEMVSRIEQS